MISQAPGLASGIHRPRHFHGIAGVCDARIQQDAVDALGDGFPADVLVTGFGDSGVDLVARFWHPSEELSARHAISEVAITIRETLAAEHIAIPFPQRVVHMRPAPTETGIDDRSDVRP